MGWPITHESDTWYGRRWAIYIEPNTASLQARPFRSAQERDAWVAKNPRSRQAVGKRHPVVKAMRQHWAHIHKTSGVVGKATWT